MYLIIADLLYHAKEDLRTSPQHPFCHVNTEEALQVEVVHPDLLQLYGIVIACVDGGSTSRELSSLGLASASAVCNENMHSVALKSKLALWDRLRFNTVLSLLMVARGPGKQGHSASFARQYRVLRL